MKTASNNGRSRRFVLAVTIIVVCTIIAPLLWRHFGQTGRLYYAIKHDDSNYLQRYLDDGGSPKVTRWTFDGKHSGPRTLIMLAGRWDADACASVLMNSPSWSILDSDSLNELLKECIRWESTSVFRLLFTRGLFDLDDTLLFEHSVLGIASSYRRWKLINGMSDFFEVSHWQTIVDDAYWVRDGEIDHERNLFLIGMLRAGISPDVQVRSGDSLLRPSNKITDRWF